MGKIIIEKWQCDCCETVFDERPNTTYPTISLNYKVGWEWSREITKYTEVCPSCSEKIYDYMKGLPCG